MDSVIKGDRYIEEMTPLLGWTSNNKGTKCNQRWNMGAS